MRFFTLVLLSIFLFGCGNYRAGLQSLGNNASFDDVTIPDDFPAPEDEVVVVEPPEVPVVEPPVTPPEAPIITPPPVQVKLTDTFALDSGLFQLNHGPAQRWDGCEVTKASQGGYLSDTRCGRAFFHPAFAENLNEVFFVCVSDAAEAAGYPQPERVFIHHVGSYADRDARNSNNLSHHAYARAWDIKYFNLFDQEGTRYRVSTYLRDYKDDQARFYDEFRDCWMESMPSSCRPGNREYKGSVGHRASKLGGNTLHNDHLHLSYPLCAGNS